MRVRRKGGAVLWPPVGSPSFVREVVAEGCLGAATGQGWMLHWGARVLVRPVECSCRGPSAFHTKRFCRIVDLARLGEKIYTSREFSVGNGRPSAAWRRTWQPRGSHRRPASPPGGAPHCLRTLLNVGPRDAWPRQAPGALSSPGEIATPERINFCPLIFPTFPIPSPLRAGAARAPSDDVQKAPNSG
jgi:hypothetical protein